MPLRTDYTNDILDTSKNTERKYNIKNSNGTIVEENVTFEDVTEYEQEGSRFGATDINATNTEVNRISGNLTASDGETFRYAKQDGVRGILVNEGGADTFVPFKGGFTIFQNGEFKVQPTTKDAVWTINSDGNLFAQGGDATGRHCYICFPYTQELSKYKKLCVEVRTDSGIGMGHRTNAVTTQIGNSRDYCSSGDYFLVASRFYKETKFIGGLALEKLAVGGYFCVIAQYASGTHYFEVSRIWLE